jgi:hypothetical protein
MEIIKWEKGMGLENFYHYLSQLYADDEYDALAHAIRINQWWFNHLRVEAQNQVLGWLRKHEENTK